MDFENFFFVIKMKYRYFVTFIDKPPEYEFTEILTESAAYD